MTENTPALVVVVPLLGAFVAGLVAIRRPAAARPIAIAALTASFAASVLLLLRVAHGEIVDYALGGWAPPAGIAYRIDGLNAPILVLIQVIGLISVFYAGIPAAIRLGPKQGPFYSLVLLLIAGLTGMTITNDVFNLYVLLEITALSSYALLALGGRRSLFATYQYLLQGSVGASFYLLGVGYLYLKTGTLNMTELATLLPGLYHSISIQVAFGMILIGMWIKMAFFPLHHWLPGAYGSAAPHVAPLVASLTTKVAVYVMIRMMLSVFTPAYVFGRLSWQPLIIWLAVAAIVVGSCWALAQRDLRRMIVWIMVAETGYMVGGVWLGVPNGFIGAAFHLINDAVMTCVLFCLAGIFLHHRDVRTIDGLNGFFARMPMTMVAFVIVACSAVGIPPTCGFFSKFYLLLASFESGNWHFGAALIFASLANAVMFFRIFEHAFFGVVHGHHHGDEKTPHPEAQDAPRGMLIPTLVGAALLLLLGVGSGRLVSLFLARMPWGNG